MKKNSIRLAIMITSILMCAIAGCSSASSDSAIYSTAFTPGDSLKFSFAAFGDTQVGETWLTNQAGNPSSTNIPQLRQTIIDINNATPKPQMIFLPGDMVLNLARDNGETLTGQLNAWQALYTSIPVTGKVPLQPIPGNHESNFKVDALDTEAPNPGAINAWLAWCGKNGYTSNAGNGPTTGGANPDSRAGEESNLTYSFNRGAIHFVIIDTDALTTKTDPVTGFVLAGWIAINWIEEDIKKAQRDPLIQTIIVAGHKPIEMPPYTSEDAGIINTTEYPLANRLSAVLNGNNKVKLYLACHCHSWDARQLGTGGVWQVITGNGGAPIEKKWDPAGGVYYGYSIVDIFDSGKIVLHNYGRALPPAPQQFYEGTPVAPEPATLRGDLVIYAP